MAKTHPNFLSCIIFLCQIAKYLTPISALCQLKIGRQKDEYFPLFCMYNVHEQRPIKKVKTQRRMRLSKNR